jgi:hypothetical protein
MQSDASLLRGVEPDMRPYETPTYCRCDQNLVEPRCGVALDVDRCDIQQGGKLSGSLRSVAFHHPIVSA